MLTALADMGATEAAPEIDRFVRLYHASADAQLAQAVVAGALALRRLDARRGDALLARSGKARDGAWQRDLTLQYLGYSTDSMPQPALTPSHPRLLIVLAARGRPWL